MKFCSRVLLRPLCFLILLGLSSFMISRLCLITKHVEQSVALESYEVRNKSFSKIETTARWLLPLNSSASNLARALSSSLNGTQLSFVAIETMVAPTLFLALSTIPQLSQVSYMGSDGLLFSFYNDGDQTIAVYSNTSFSRKWYTQPVNRDTGMLYGEAIASDAIVAVNKSWFQEALNSTNGFSSIGTGWNQAQDLQFFHTVAMDGRGLISLGFLAKVVIDHFVGMDFHGGDFHLATEDGQVLVQTELPDTRIVVGNGSVAVQSLTPEGDFKGLVSNISCKHDDDNNGKFESQNVKIKGEKYLFYCSTIEIAGVQSVYVLAFPSKGLLSFVHKNSKLAHTLLGLIFVGVFVSISIFICFIVRAARREMFLCAALVKQMEATQQAERKSMNKSIAFASASHDMRAALAAITGLIELSREDASSCSELAANLAQMNICAKDLLGILNTVLDTSKIEAGKMQLVEEEFNLAELLEEVVDLYYKNGMKKGVDVVLDPCDSSILKSHLIKGDRGKLKQILCNLLGNAIKFTSEGHVSLRAMVKKTSFESSIIASNHNYVLKCLSRLWYKDREGLKDLDALHRIQRDPNYMEFVFEVDDTGRGIPKDKQKSVFENFVQVKETAQGQEGVGLGLGIVQSLVRLMGGEIGIVDKELGERGTCFKFNIFLAAFGAANADIEEENFIGMHSDRPLTDFHQHFGLHLRPSMPKSEGSHVVLLIASDERRRISKKLIESFGIKVSAVKRGRDLYPVLEKIKHKLDLSCFSPSRKTDQLGITEHLSGSASPSDNSISGGNDGPLGMKKSNSKNSLSFILIVIDGGAGIFSELCAIVANFRKDIQNSRCKVVWLDNPITRNAHCSSSKGDWLAPPCDLMVSKPFHGSRLYQVLNLLPEFGGAVQCNLPRLKVVETAEEKRLSANPNCSGSKSQICLSSYNHQVQEIVIHEGDEQKTPVKPLDGKKILVVEDNRTLRTVATMILRKLGAEVDVCENGKEALDRVCEVLGEQGNEGLSEVVRYSYIFMDCEMPVMNGYEATRRIRMEEKNHGIHIPIIALTAHAEAEEAAKTRHAGMDFHLTKPVETDKLLEVIRSIDRK